MTYPNYTAPSPGGSDVWGQALNDYIKTLTTAPLGSPDRPPASPNAKDDEFDGTSSVTWTATPTAPNAFNINSTRPGHAYIKASGSGANYVGRYQAVPGAYPYTITSKLAATTRRANFQRGGGIILGAASPTGASGLVYLGALFNSTQVFERITAQFDGTFVSQSSGANPGYLNPMYLRFTVNSASSVDCYLSVDGALWILFENINPGFTPGVMGIALNDETAAIGCEAQFDFFRVT